MTGHIMSLGIEAARDITPSIRLLCRPRCAKCDADTVASFLHSPVKFDDSSISRSSLDWFGKTDYPITNNFNPIALTHSLLCICNDQHRTARHSLYIHRIYKTHPLQMNRSLRYVSFWKVTKDWLWNWNQTIVIAIAAWCTWIRAKPIITNTVQHQTDVMQIESSSIPLLCPVQASHHIEPLIELIAANDDSNIKWNLHPHPGRQTREHNLPSYPYIHPLSERGVMEQKKINRGISRRTVHRFAFATCSLMLGVM